jgi:hypothetical protein
VPVLADVPCFVTCGPGGRQKDPAIRSPDRGAAVRRYTRDPSAQQEPRKQQARNAAPTIHEAPLIREVYRLGEGASTAVLAEYSFTVGYAEGIGRAGRAPGGQKRLHRRPEGPIGYGAGGAASGRAATVSALRETIMTRRLLGGLLILGALGLLVDACLAGDEITAAPASDQRLGGQEGSTIDEVHVMARWATILAGLALAGVLWVGWSMRTLAQNQVQLARYMKAKLEK